MSTIQSTIPTASTGGSGEDHHASWFEVITGQTVTISARKQMAVFGPFLMDGTLNIDGQLILET